MSQTQSQQSKTQALGICIRSDTTSISIGVAATDAGAPTRGGPLLTTCSNPVPRQCMAICRENFLIRVFRREIAPVHAPPQIYCARSRHVSIERSLLPSDGSMSFEAYLAEAAPSVSIDRCPLVAQYPSEPSHKRKAVHYPRTFLDTSG
jgi:hypothetical protein